MSLLTLVIRTVFLIGALTALIFSHSKSLSLSWALFLCLIAAVCVVGTFMWESRKPFPPERE